MNALILFAAAAGSTALEPVIVTATRREELADRVLASVEILRGDDLLRLPAAELSDALRFQPGIEPVRLGAPGQQTSIFVRGTESNHVLVLVDGLRINPGTIGTAAIQNFAPEFVERVEVVKGPRSALYGSDAIGGVINVITRGAGDSGSASLGFGSFDTKTASFGAGTGDDHTGAMLAGSWIDSAGFPTQAGDGTDRGYHNLSFTASGHTAVGAADVGARIWHAAGNTEYSSFGTQLDQDFRNSAFALYAAIAPNTMWRSRVTAGYALDEIDQNQLGAFDFNGIKDFAHTRRWSLDWQNDLAISESFALTAGVLWQDEDADSESFDLSYAADTTTTQTYLQSESTFGRQRLLLAAAYLEHEVFGGHATWNAAYGIEAGEGALVTLAAGTGFRAPDATDLYGFGANPGLDPEESRSYEISWRQALGERQSVTLAAFRNDIDDLIDFVIISFVPFQGENRNIDKVRIEGVEASWQYVADDWSAHVSATLQDPRDRTTDERLLRRARENYTAAVVKRFGGHEVALDVLYAGERRDNDAIDFDGRVQLEAYWLAGLSGKIALGEHFSVFARIENLFDEDYQLAHTYNTVERSYYGAIRYEFR
ncbi:MAG: TonB-dependent receptor [Gammaproteobacteria bacterium]|nr:TonB-dependent receptor [Gammaproteobacteria bacterium]